MRKQLFIFSILVLFLSLFSACKKGSASETYTPVIIPVIPDFTTQVIASVAGFITDENNNAVAGVQVTAGSSTVSTDNFGYFKCNNIGFSKTAGFIKALKAGYFAGYKTFLPVEGKQSFVRLQLLPKNNIGSIPATAGGTVSTASGLAVVLPANGIVVASTGAAYAGSVNVAAQWLNSADINTTSLTMPGNLSGIDTAGNLNTLVTYGMIAVELTSSTGELLQIASGKKAMLHFPIPASLAATAPASISLWYFDETKGVWKQEGRAIINGNNYEGAVSHFSYWNCDIGMPSMVNFSAQLLTASLQPLSNVAVYLHSRSSFWRSVAYTYTDANGFVYGMIPDNLIYDLYVITDCGNQVFVQNFSTSGNTDLGSIVADIQQYQATFTGTVKKCDNSLVTNGDVIIGNAGYYQAMPIQNGSFNYTGAVCPNANASVVAIDRDALQQSNLQNVTVTTGANNLGNFSACSAVTENITCTLDGVSTAFTLPQYLFNANYYFASDSTDIQAIDLLNGNNMVFHIGEGITSLPGSYPIHFVYFRNKNYYFVNPTNITISRYGLLGNFISGFFSGNVRDISNNSMHTMQCNFQVKRDL